jgi:hypothetical protein
MAHAARIDSNGVVREVLVVDDDKFKDANGKTIQGKVGTFPQDELLMEYMESLGLHDPTLGEEWRFTSYNGNFRGKYAGQGFTYDRQADQFIPPETPISEES